MTLLERHLEQILLSAESIAALPFPPPKIFVNALLSTPEITSLVRDTKPHELALFSVPAPPSSVTSAQAHPSHSSRRQTVFNVAHGEVKTAPTGTRAPRRNTAVATVLGPELHEKVQKTQGKASGEMDVEVLLRGIEKLNAVYSLPGVTERVQELRSHYAQVSWAVKHYEKKVERQVAELEEIHRGDEVFDDLLDGDELNSELGGVKSTILVTHEDLAREEDEIRDLEEKRRNLEARIHEMEKDLGGLSR
ncbi:hypothetical protein K3495_g504 [Podosphaera aphanis]|nr:hypothetical protein K3495_g504 [Podosphaera aphanis]